MVILALLLMWKWRASLIQTASAAYVAVTGEVAPWLKNGDTDIATIVLSPDSVPAEEAPSLSGSKYAYSTLSEDGKLVYDQVYDAIMNRKTDVSVSTLDAAVLEQAYNCVMADYGDSSGSMVTLIILTRAEIRSQALHLVPASP